MNNFGRAVLAVGLSAVMTFTGPECFFQSGVEPVSVYAAEEKAVQSKIAGDNSEEGESTTEVTTEKKEESTTATESQESQTSSERDTSSGNKEHSQTEHTTEGTKRNTSGTSGNTDQAEDTTKETAAASGIVCWGDDLINGEESATYSYMAVLQKLLTDNGYNLPVINKTLQGGGTLSMMKMAGVSDETLQGYITKHQQAANGAQLNVTETGIRDLTEEQTTRNDTGYIPVIFMGYYGGWNHDPAELGEQQEQILNTFPDKSRFIVVGTRPMDSSVSSDTLDQVLSQKWGEHYISLANVTAQPSATYEHSRQWQRRSYRNYRNLIISAKADEINETRKLKE